MSLALRYDKYYDQEKINNEKKDPLDQSLRNKKEKEKRKRENI